jgi:hypothetical protein
MAATSLPRSHFPLTKSGQEPECGVLRNLGDDGTASCRGLSHSSSSRVAVEAANAGGLSLADTLPHPTDGAPCAFAPAPPLSVARNPYTGSERSQPHAAISGEGSRREQEALASQVERGAPTPRPLPHLQAVDLAFDRAGTPGPHQARFDGLIIGAQPRRKAPQGRHTAGDGARQPPIETVGVALTHDPTNVLSQLEGHRHVARVGLKLGEERRVLVGPLPRPLQHHPGGATRGRWRAPPLHDQREGMARALRARRSLLRLTETLRIACHRRRAAGVAVASEIPPALSGLPTPGVPPLQEALWIGGEEALPEMGVPLTRGACWGLEIAYDGHPPDAEWLSHGAIGPPLPVSRPHLCIHGQPP